MKNNSNGICAKPHLPWNVMGGGKRSKEITAKAVTCCYKAIDL